MKSKKVPDTSQNTINIITQETYHFTPKQTFTEQKIIEMYHYYLKFTEY